MKKRILYFAALSFLTLSIHASDVPYSYAELGYASSDIDDGVIDTDGDGFKIAGSFALTDSIYAFGDYADYGLDFDVDLAWYGLGVGYHYEISPNTDLIADIAYRNADFDIPGVTGDTDESGYALAVGLRSMINPSIELGGRIEYVDLDSSETFFEVNGMYYFGNGFGAGANASFSGDLSLYGAKLRYTF